MRIVTIVCDSCGRSFEGRRKEFPKGWRSKNNKDLCPRCPDPVVFGREKKARRNAQIVADRESGMRHRELAEKHGLSMAQINQILFRGKSRIIIYEQKS